MTLISACLDQEIVCVTLLTPIGDESSGVMGLCNALRQEDCKSKIRYHTKYQASQTLLMSLFPDY